MPVSSRGTLYDGKKHSEVNHSANRPFNLTTSKKLNFQQKKISLEVSPEKEQQILLNQASAQLTDNQQNNDNITIYGGVSQPRININASMVTEEIHETSKVQTSMASPNTGIGKTNKEPNSASLVLGTTFDNEGRKTVSKYLLKDHKKINTGNIGPESVNFDEASPRRKESPQARQVYHWLRMTCQWNEEMPVSTTLLFGVLSLNLYDLL